MDLKKAYQLAGGACRLAVALALVSNAIKVWTENIEVVIREDVPKDDIIKAMGSRRSIKTKLVQNPF